MATGFQKIFWGFFIATFHLTSRDNKNFPDFVGCILVMIGLSSLLKELDFAEFRYAKTLVFLQICLSLMSSMRAFDLFMSTKNPMLTFFWLLINALLVLYVYYYILAGTIRYFKETEDRPLERKYITKLRSQLVIALLGQMALILARTFQTDTLSLIAIVCVPITSISFLCVIGNLHQTFKPREMEKLN